MAAKGVNKAIIIGNLGRDPDVKFMPSGGQVTNLAIATSESWKDKTTGEKRENTEWHRVVAFGKLAEIMGEYLKKGSQVYIEGRLQTRSWEKDGQKHFTTEIVANEMQMLGGRPQGGQGQQGQQQGGYPQYGQQPNPAPHPQQNYPGMPQQAGGPPPVTGELGEDDIPFAAYDGRCA